MCVFFCKPSIFCEINVLQAFLEYNESIKFYSPSLFYSYRDKNGSLENVNNTKYEPYYKREMNGKPPNNTVAQLRENIYHSPVSI